MIICYDVKGLHFFTAMLQTIFELLVRLTKNRSFWYNSYWNLFLPLKTPLKSSPLGISEWWWRPKICQKSKLSKLDKIFYFERFAHLFELKPSKLGKIYFWKIKTKTEKTKCFLLICQKLEFTFKYYFCFFVFLGLNVPFYILREYQRHVNMISIYTNRTIPVIDTNHCRHSQISISY